MPEFTEEEMQRAITRVNDTKLMGWMELQVIL